MARLRGALAVAVALVATTPAWAHQGNPNFMSEVDSAPGGVAIEVLNRDDRLLVRDAGGEQLVIEGYDDEPYARIDADGAVFVNTDSPAYHLNQERFGGVPVPADADGQGPPRWKKVDDSGRFEWHDHRMHWMAEGRPPQVEDAGRRTTVFEWSVPTSRGPISGTLHWTPSPGAPIAFIVIGSVVVLGGCAAALIVRRRREPEAW